MRKGSTSGSHLLVILLIAVILIVPSISTAALQEPPPVFRASPARVGEVPGGAPMNNSTLWTYETADPVQSSPVVSDGKLFVGTMGGEVLCLDALTGQRVWTYQTGGPVESSPAVLGGRVYIGSDDTYLYCLDATDGSLLWRTATGGEIKSSPVVRGGSVFVGSNDFKVYSFDWIEGEEMWIFPTGGYVYSSPALFDDTLYFGSCDGNMYAVNASNGNLVWNYTADFCPASPAVTEDLVIFGAYDGLLHYLNRTNGEQIHSVPIYFAEIYSSAGLFTWSMDTYDLPIVFAATTAGKMVGIGPDGEEFWNTSHGAGITSSPLVVTEVEEPYDPFIIYGDEGGRLHGIEVMNPYVIRPEYVHNFVEWHIELGSSIQSSPFAWHEKVYVGVVTSDGGGKVVCIGSIDGYDEVYIELVDPDPVGGVRFVVHNLVPDRATVEFEGQVVDADPYFIGGPDIVFPPRDPDGYSAACPEMPPEGMKQFIIRIYVDDELVLTRAGQVMCLIEGWNEVNVTIDEPKDQDFITEGILVVSGTVSTNYTITRVYAVLVSSNKTFNCTGTSNWTLALETADLEQGWTAIHVRAVDEYRKGSDVIVIHIGSLEDDREDNTGLGIIEIVMLLVLLVVLAVLFRTKPPRASEKASDP